MTLLIDNDNLTSCCDHVTSLLTNKVDISDEVMFVEDPKHNSHRECKYDIYDLTERDITVRSSVTLIPNAFYYYDSGRVIWVSGDAVLASGLEGTTKLRMIENTRLVCVKGNKIVTGNNHYIGGNLTLHEGDNVKCINRSKTRCVGRVDLIEIEGKEHLLIERYSGTTIQNIDKPEVQISKSTTIEHEGIIYTADSYAYEHKYMTFKSEQNKQIIGNLADLNYEINYLPIVFDLEDCRIVSVNESRIYFTVGKGYGTKLYRKRLGKTGKSARFC